ncbi:hypothetical protein SSX86_019095 [Deinandra increscens subsp. villosa]|uniref:Integrase catalytic domain-containing protein n=1 Tax=Deinandra increscens subsp. villosa TaxID=3103831 RepID=A0AAP0CTK8_9ASTR
MAGCMGKHQEIAKGDPNVYAVHAVHESFSQRMGCMTSGTGLMIEHGIMACNSSLLHSKWIIDTGASDHMCHDIHLFSDIHLLHKPVSIGLPNGQVIKVTHTGTVIINSNLSLFNVLHIPQFTHNLLSVPKLCESTKGILLFTHNSCLFQAPSLKRPLVLGELVHGLYLLNQNLKTSVASSFVVSKSFCNVVVNNKTWHTRLGHLPVYKLKQLHLLSDSNFDSIVTCGICPKARQHKLSFPHSTISTTHAFEIIHIDTWGPYSVPTYNGHKYFLTIVDDFTRTTWTHLLSTKSNAFSVLQSFIEMVSTQYNTKVKCVRSDNAFELGSGSVQSAYLKSKGILHQTCCVGVPQQNGVVERKHKHLLETARALLFQSKLPISFWGECVLTATHLINRFPSKLLNNKSPFELLTGKAPSYHHLRAFGCLCYASTLKAGRDKFQPRAVPCIFLGYPVGKKAYRLFDLTSKSFFVSRDVIFFENVFPTLQQSNASIFPVFDSCFVDDFPISSSNPSLPSDCSSSSFPFMSDPISTSPVSPTLPVSSPSVPPPTLPVRQSTRISKPPIHLQDYVFDLSTLPSTSQNLLHSLDSIIEPQSYTEAAKHPEWLEAMKKEFDALEANKTWIVVDIPPHKKPIRCKWVYKVKYHADGTLERCKARLVVRGDTQTYGIDYLETFSPVVKMTTIRTLIVVATKMNWVLSQLDVNNAFLHGDLDEDIYMHPPQGMNLLSSQCLKLQKSLYGLKQASRQWYGKLSAALLSKGYKRSSNDHSLFSKVMVGSVVYLAVYVDDIIITGSNTAEIDSLKDFLHTTFKIKDLGFLNYFLGIEVLQHSDGLILTQRKFAKDMVAEFFIDSPPVVSSPLPSALSLKLNEGDLVSDPLQYRRLVGKLNYLTNTRPDLSFAVQHLSQFMQDPRLPHWKAALHTLAYVHGSFSQGLFFNKTSDCTLTAYCDSDWASCPNTRKSVSGYFITFGGSPISWKSKKQNTVSLSSAEAEYRSLRRVTAELTWLIRLLADFQVPDLTPVTVNCDSQAAIHIAKNPVFHERTKHIELDCHFVREKLQDGLISLVHTPTQSQLADLLTKSLPKHQHHHLLSKFGVLQPQT